MNFPNEISGKFNRNITLGFDGNPIMVEILVYA